MRTLSILRKKSFVGMAGTLKVYIEDPQNGDLKINGVPCRKLGNLKNNQQVQFSIGEEETRVYLIADRISKDYCNEFYPIPAGTEDISLSGKCHYNPFLGNPFRFDGVTDESVLANRKKGGGKSIAVIIVAALLGAVIGYVATSGILNSTEPKTFSNAGMQITLTDSFRESKQDGFDAFYVSKNAAVLCLKESFSLMPGLEDYTLQQYGQLVINNNQMGNEVTLHTDGKVTYFTYTADVDGKTFYYYATVHKSQDAFWLIQFYTQEKDAQEYYDQFSQWAQSVRFE